MSIALQRNNTDAVVVANGSFNHDLDTRVERTGFVGSKMTCISIYATDKGSVSPIFGGGDRSKVLEDESTTSSTSSIGKNSDDELSPGDCEEVQSEYKATGGLGNLEALEEVLPIKRSISQFYTGKSKSFTSLGDAVCSSSIKDIVKPENAYTRKRKNLLAYRNIWDNKNQNGIKRSNSSGILKRQSHSHSRSNLAFAATLASADTIKNNSDDSNSNSNSNSNSPTRGGPCLLPPLPPQAKIFTCNDLSSPPLQQKFSSWRSFSLCDLQGVSSIHRPSGQ